MGKLLDAVREKNGGTLSPEHEKFVAGIEDVFQSEITKEVTASEVRNSKAMNEALAVIGNLPKGEDGSTTTIVEQLRSMAEKMDKLESISTRKMSNTEKFHLRTMLEKNKDAIIKATQSSSPEAVEIVFNACRAASLMTTQNVITGAAVNTGMNLEWDNEIAFIKYPENFVLDIIRSRQVSKVPANKVKREQNSREGQAAVTAEGAVKPLVSYTFLDKIYPRKKIAAHMEWTEEFEMDFESLFNAILDLFETDLLRDWHRILLNTIITAAPGYVSTPLDGAFERPNIYTAIGASVLSVQTLLFEPNVIWMNPADVWAMNLAQDTTGQVIIPPIMVGNNQIAGMRLYVSTEIAAGHALIGDSNTWREEHTGFITRIGLINDQLIRNEKTIVGEVFSLMYQAVRDQGSWIYVDLAAVMAALQKEA